MHVDEVPKKKRSAAPGCSTSLSKLQGSQNVYKEASRLWTPAHVSEISRTGRPQGGLPARQQTAPAQLPPPMQLPVSRGAGGQPLRAGEFTLFNGAKRVPVKPSVAPEGRKVDYKIYNSFNQRAGLESFRTTSNKHVANVGTGGHPTVASYFTGKLISPVSQRA